jgi:glycosyltransferase involved in cell wall biosynthesis
LDAKADKGMRYAQEIADWQKVMDRYEDVLSPTGIPDRHPHHSISLNPRQAVHQILPNLAYGDAISNHARWIRRELHKAGVASEIFVRYIDPRVAAECRVFSPGCISAEDAILYHHSIGSELTPHVVAHRGPKCLIYHNITPAEFFEPFRPKLARLLRKGREDLKLLASHFPVSVGVSEYNASELRESGFANPRVFPICVDPAEWNFAPDATLMEKLQGENTNLLFVGRLSPQKKQDDLIRVFLRYLEFEPEGRLHLVGGTEPDDPYLAHLHRTADSLGLNGQVNFAGPVNDAQLAAYYHTADLFWSMSEHEGFCVPLVEAMWFNIPILAFKSTATPETLGPSGLLFTAKQDEEKLAALAYVLVRDEELRRKLLASQHRRRSEYLPAAVEPKLFSTVAAMIQDGGRP